MGLCDENFPLVIKECLSLRTPIPLFEESSFHRHAGVLIPLVQDKGCCRVLFTKRTATMENHSGQICFPGGSVDETDGSAEETALREAYEEIGLRRKDVVLLGRLDDTCTLASNFVIHPYVGMVSGAYEFNINCDEVEKLIEVPLEAFHPDRRENASHFDFEGRTYSTSLYRFEGEVIWGATARIMENFMEIIGHNLRLPGE
jgi:8-oxo-dGTP pyrophosphatase MutT (NUDIX family)